MSKSQPSRPIASVVSTFRILEEVAQRQPVGVSEIARATGIPKSTVQRSLLTLQHVGWLRIVEPERARWGVTSKPLSIGLRAAGETNLREVAAPYLHELRNITHETVHLSVREQDEVIVMLRSDSTQAVRTYVDLGTKAPIYTSSGIAMMAYLSQPEIEELVEAGLKHLSNGLYVSPDRVLAEVNKARERGYAVMERSWWRPEVSAIAAAVTDEFNQPIAAVAVSIPSARFESGMVELWGAQATATARKISEELQGH